MTPQKTRSISGRAVVAALAALLALGLAFNWYNNDQQDKTVDRNVEQILDG